MAGGAVVKPSVWLAHEYRFKPNLGIFLLFDFHVHSNVKLYMQDMYELYTLSEQVYTQACMIIQVLLYVHVLTWHVLK